MFLISSVTEENGGHFPHDGFAYTRGGPRQSSLNAALDAKHKAKKKQGLLKGIGSMFRFGKHRKTLDVPLHVALRAEQQQQQQQQQEMMLGMAIDERQAAEEREAARRAAQEEHQRIHEQFKRLVHRQQVKKPLLIFRTIYL